MLELANAVLEKEKSFRFRAQGSSMIPFILNGDVITIQPLRGKVPGIGSVVAFERTDPNMLVVHRVVSRNGDTMFIKGDNADECIDRNIPIEKIFGVVSLIERDGRKVRLGIGRERLMIAWLSRMRLLIPMRIIIATLGGRNWRKRGAA